MTSQDINDIRQATYKMCRAGLQTVIMTLLLGTTSSFVLITNAQAAPSTLKGTAVINDDVVRLGDIFDNTERADAVLGAAPEIGKDMTLNAGRLQRIAEVYAVEWKPKSAGEQIIIRRDSHTIDLQTITDALKASLTEKGIQGNFNLDMANLSTGITLPANIDATVEITNVNYTPGRDVFSATVAVPSAEKPVKTVQVSGLITRTVSVPSLNKATRLGDIISASDIAWMDVPERSITNDTILDADDLIGKTPNRILTASRPVRTNDVQMPQLVARGDDVTILYEMNGMTLSAKGKSQQGGAQGDLIRVTNLSSAKSMSAQVTGDRTVTVQ